MEALGNWPFLTPVPAPASFPVAGASLPGTAATCTGCHPVFGKEWSASTHAYALRDLQFLAELSKPESPRWLCLNCHIPTPAQRKSLPTLDSRLDDPAHLLGLHPAPNPAYDPGRVTEGVTCASCHLRTDEAGDPVVIGPGFGGNAPHPVKADKAGLDTICLQCHSPGPAKLSPSFFCWFETQEELSGGPDREKQCIDCHMPATERPLVPGGPVRAAREHHWVGSGIPKSPEGYSTLLERGWKPGLSVSVQFQAPSQLSLQLTNRSGHALPTADPERHLLVETRLETSDGHVIERDSLRIGQRWDWGNPAADLPPRRLADERLQAGAIRTYQPSFSTPDWTGLRVIVEVRHVRLNPEYLPDMAAAKVDPELEELWPGVSSLLPSISSRYPISLFLYREVLDPASGLSHVDSPAELIERSRYDVPTPQ